MPITIPLSFPLTAHTAIVSDLTCTDSPLPKTYPPGAKILLTDFQAYGGTKPYTYTVSDSSKAQIDSSGNLVLTGNGAFDLILNDAAGAVVKLPITVKGIKTMLVNEATWGTWQEANNHCAARNARLPTVAELQAFYDRYKTDHPNANVAELLKQPMLSYNASEPGAHYGVWAADPAGAGMHKFFNMPGNSAIGETTPVGPDQDIYKRPIFCIR